MKRKIYSILGVLCIVPCVMAQNESELNRSVTVERDFQPVIQSAGKVATKPEVVETTIEPAQVEYSNYTVSVEPEATISPLLSQPTRFMPADMYHGYVRGGLGHANTLFDLGYHLNNGKQSKVDVFAHHRAQWVEPVLSKTVIGANFTHSFKALDVFVGVNGGNLYYHKFGYHYAASIPNNSTALWLAEVFAGVQSNNKSDLHYRVQTGYKLFSKIGAVSEHQIRTRASLEWNRDVHHVGANLYVQNNFLKLGTLAAVIPDSLYNDRHNIRIEPYYEYKGTRVRVHAGVNLDVNVGIGQNELSATKNVSFAPSPHVNMEAELIKNRMTMYADVTGSFGLGTLQEFMEENRYRMIHDGIIEHHVAPYVPVDAELGFRIKPHKDLLLDIHGGYALMKNQEVWIATGDSSLVRYLPNPVKMRAGEFSFFHADYQRGKIGAKANYHYRDIIRFNLHGEYFFWWGDSVVYDRPNWQLGLRIDGKIDEHWSVYSDNHFAGKRIAKVYYDASKSYTDVTLSPTIELNLGVEYNMWVGKKVQREKLRVKSSGEQILRPESKPNLTLFAQLNNFIHRRNETYFEHHSAGINCVIGATFRF